MGTQLKEVSPKLTNLGEIHSAQITIIPENIDFDIKELDKNIREEDMKAILRQQGYALLRPLGLNNEDVDNLVNIWERLKNRRQRKDH